MLAGAITALLLGTQPLPGESFKTVHAVPLITSAPETCISIPAGEGSFVLDSAEVSEMARPRSTQWKTESERMLLVRSAQAQELINHVSTKKDSLGCDVTVDSLGNGVYALLEIINRGHGRVWEATSNSFLPAVERVEYNINCSQGPLGTYTFRKPGGYGLIMITACVI